MEPKIWFVTDGEDRTIAGGTDEQAIRREYEESAYAVRRGALKPPLTLFQGNRVLEENPDPNDAWSAKQPCSKLALQGAANILYSAARSPETSWTHAAGCLEVLEHFPEEHRIWNNDVRRMVERKKAERIPGSLRRHVATLAIRALLDRVESVLPPCVPVEEWNDKYVHGATEGCLALLQALSGHAMSDIDTTMGLTVLIGALRTARWNDEKFKLPLDSIHIAVDHFMEMPAL